MAAFVSALPLYAHRGAPPRCSVRRAHRVARRTCRLSADPTPPPVQEDISEQLRDAVKDLKQRMKRCTLYFVGPMGSGKSAVGKFMAHQLGFRFLDTDELIEIAAGKSISSIFDDEGEPYFRDLETTVLDQVQPFLECCVATGGGIVMRRNNWGKMQTGIVVFLDAPVDVLVRRLEGDATRPLLQDADDLRERVAAILDKRRSMYEQADVTVPVSEGDAVDNTTLECCRRLSNFIKENPPRLAELYSAGLEPK